MVAEERWGLLPLGKDEGMNLDKEEWVFYITRSGKEKIVG
jgi:hypothetical protein